MQNNFRHVSTDDTLNVRGKNLVKQEQVAYVFLPALALGILSCLWRLGQYTASYSKSITFSCISRIMCSSGSRNPSLKPGGCTPLSGLCRDTLFFAHLSLTGNKMQTAVINVRKYKRILYFLMFISAVCFLFLLYGDVPLNRE